MVEKPAPKGASSAADVFIGFIDSLMGNHTVSADVGALIKAAINHRRAEVDAAVAAGVKPKEK